MKSVKSVKVIFDTNIWISYLIGKKLKNLTELIAEQRITIVVTDRLLEEILEVTRREKLVKYFPKQSVKELMEFLDIVAEYHKVSPKYYLSRDEKDNFILDLVAVSKANYVVTGDKDLLELVSFRSAQILSPSAFEVILKEI